VARGATVIRVDTVGSASEERAVRLLPAARRDLVKLGVLALVIRAVYVWSITSIYGLQQHSDFHYMEELAKSLAAGRGFTLHGERIFNQSVGYPATIALVYRLFGAHIELAFVVNVLAGVAAVLLIYLFATLLFQGLDRSPSSISVRTVAFVSGTLAAVYPDSLLYAAFFGAENLLVPLMVLCLIVSMWPARDVVVGVLVGVLSAAFLSMKAYAVFLCPFIPVMWWLSGRRVGTRMVAACLAGIICLAPWTYLNYRASGGYILPFGTATGETFLDGTNPKADGRPTGVFLLDPATERAHGKVELDRLKLRTALGYAKERPGWYVALVFRKFAYSVSPARDHLYQDIGQRLYTPFLSRWFPTLFNAFLLLGVFLGVAVTYRIRELAAMALGTLAGMFLLQMVFFGYPRYRYPFLFCLLPFVALGWTSLCSRWNAWIGRTRSARPPLAGTPAGDA
jgi:4-amino-4-deoxy-L-arabinose transferase-like glycosyltransferase